MFGLSPYTDERVLKEVFAQYGPVQDIQVILDHYSKVSRGFAFVYMSRLQDAIQVRTTILSLFSHDFAVVDLELIYYWA